MNKEIAEKWCTALRSGEYKQGLGSLCCEDKYCCLGVLCELAVKEGAIEEYEKANSFPPEKVLKWSGLKTENGYIRSAATSLVQLNDSDFYDFNQIADIIEDHVEEL